MNIPPQEYWRPETSESYYTSFISRYSPIENVLAGLKSQDTECVEPVIRFLEDDPYAIGTGYLKEKAWKYLWRVPLTEDQNERLHRVALTYVEKRLSREFFPMCRFVAGIADNAFEKEIDDHTLSTDPKILRPT